MSDNVQLQGTKRGYGLVRIGPGYRENQSWQRIDNGGGRYAGREYYDRRPPVPDPDSGNAPAPGGVGRLITVGGLSLALTGFVGWLWQILSFVRAIGSNTVADHPFAIELTPGLPLGTASLVAVLSGAVIAAIGAGLAKAARRRSEQETFDPYRPL